MTGSKAKDIHPRDKVLNAIRKAKKVAGNDDVEFVRALRSAFHAKGGDKKTGTRSFAPDVDEKVQDLKIFKDPRYARNARLLAERTRLRTTGMRILGGTFTKQEDFPDCVAVGYKGGWGCSGTLIAPDVVLTAGHCTTAMTRIFVGQNVNESKKTNKIVKVREAKPHPKYSNRDTNDDLMILMLEEKVKGVVPRKIAPSVLIQNATDVRAVGFGTTDRQAEEGFGVKRMTDVPVASNSCDGRFDGQADATVYGCHAGLELIAGKPLLDKDTCKGDSGGPVYVSDSNGVWYLAGVTSRATDLRTDTCGDGGVYVRVDKYRNWIDSIPGVTLPK